MVSISNNTEFLQHWSQPLSQSTSVSLVRSKHADEQERLPVGVVSVLTENK